MIEFLKENNYLSYKTNEPLEKHTTLRVGGKAAIFFIPETTDELKHAIRYMNQEGIPYKVLGNGSNILWSDQDYEGVVISTKKALNFATFDEETIHVGSGYSLVKLAYQCMNHSLTGLEFTGGIPGTIGGALYMNAGAYNREMKDVLVCATVIDDQGNIEKWDVNDFHYAYRTSILQKKKNHFILDATLKLEKGDKSEILNTLQSRKERRLSTQPLQYPSCGSVFRNPENTYAYQLIDHAGLRGHKMGGAQISEKHCNFILNINHAKAQDIKDLIDLVLERVYQMTKIELVPEVELFNW